MEGKLTGSRHIWRKHLLMGWNLDVWVGEGQRENSRLSLSHLAQVKGSMVPPLTEIRGLYGTLSVDHVSRRWCHLQCAAFLGAMICGPFDFMFQQHGNKFPVKYRKQ